MRSAAAFQLRTMPWRSLLMIASSEKATMAANISCWGISGVVPSATLSPQEAPADGGTLSAPAAIRRRENLISGCKPWERAIERFGSGHEQLQNNGEGKKSHAQDNCSR